MQGIWKIAFTGEKHLLETLMEDSRAGEYATSFGSMSDLLENSYSEFTDQGSEATWILESESDGTIGGISDVLNAVHAHLPDIDIILITMALDYVEDWWDVEHWKGAGKSFQYTFPFHTIAAYLHLEVPEDEFEEDEFDDEKPENHELYISIEELVELFGSLDDGC